MRVMHLRPDELPLCGDQGLLEQEPAAAGWIWIDLERPDPAMERTLLAQRLGVHSLAVQDAQRERHPPKVEVFGDMVFVLLKGLTAETLDIHYQTLQIAAFVADRVLVTRRDQRSVSIDAVWEEVAGGALNAASSPAHVLYRIARAVTDRYTQIILAVELRFDELEDQMFERPDDRLLAELSEYSTRLKKLRRILTYQHGAMSTLVRLAAPQNFVVARHEFNDLYENTERLASLCALYQELAADLMQTYISLTSHRLNQIIKVLTIVTVIFLPLGLIAGLYGMNFQHMPGGGASGGFFLTIAGMGGLAAVLLAVFRRLRWI